jgi:hypothetical protein
LREGSAPIHHPAAPSLEAATDAVSPTVPCPPPITASTALIGASTPRPADSLVTRGSDGGDAASEYVRDF